MRSHVLVGDVGERIAAAFYGVKFAPPCTPGYDLVDQQGRRVQVKTLRLAPERPRTIIGEIKQPPRHRLCAAAALAAYRRRPAAGGRDTAALGCLAGDAA